RGQPAAGCGLHGSHRGNFQRSHRRAGLQTGVLGIVARAEKFAADSGAEKPADVVALGTAQRGSRFLPAAGAGPEITDGLRPEGGDAPEANEGRIASDALRVAG